jgi:bifunctional non-homologous end joining protein LigD
MKRSVADNFSLIEPMKALPVRDLPSGDWLYEMKFDGYRALAFKAGKEVRLISRNQIDFGNDYPQLLDALKLLSPKNVIIDGEIAALDSERKTSFQLLQSYGSRKRIPLVYHAFDLLNLEGTDLCSRPLVQRRKLLAKVLKKASDNIRFSEELRGTKEELLQVARQFQVEGLIAKKPESVYERFLIETLSFPQEIGGQEPVAQEEQKVFETGTRLSKLPHRTG